jgi:heat shock protein HslJ
LLVLPFLLAGACADDPITGPSVLTGTVWKLRSLRTDGPAVLTLDPSRYTVQFGEDGRLSVRADCNVCGGPYQARRETLSVGTLACTRAFCGPESRGDDYTAILNGARLYEVTGETLVLVAPGGLLTYQP